MKRAFVLVALFGMMFALQYAHVDILGGEVDPLTLASIGFTALFAFTIGEIGSRIGLPRVTGYIVTGVCLGPSVSDILSSSVVEQMSTFNTLALGLIAITAGLELDLKATLKVGKTLASTVVIKVVLLLALVGGTLVAAQHFFGVFEFENPNTVYAFALIFGVLGIGTSPAIVLAVINDTGAKGRLSDIVLAMAVVKDLVVVVSLAVAIAIGKALLSADGAFDPHALVLVAEEIGLSILAGAVIGGVIIAYIRFVHADMLLFVVALILLVAEASHLLHLELLLVFIVAGFLVRNFSPYEHDLHHPLEVVALPVFVVFFTTAGAAIDLRASLTVLPIAIALSVARLVAFYAASRAGAVLSGETAEVKRWSWLAYIPQAGVTLGLVLLAAKAFPDHGESITSLGMALVALNLLVGPVTLGLSLKRSGETAASAVDDVDGVEAPATGDDPPAQSAELVREPEVLDLRTADVSARLDSEALSKPLNVALNHLDRLVATARHFALEQLQRSHRQLGEPLGETLKEEARLKAFKRLGNRCNADDLGGQNDKLTAALAEARQVLTEVPPVVRVRLEPRWLATPAGASLGLRVKTALRRLRVRVRPSGRAAHRAVPLRTIVRMTFEQRFIDALTAVIDHQHRRTAHLYEEMRHSLEGRREPSETLGLLATHVEDGGTAMLRDGRHHLNAAADAAVALCLECDTPRLGLSEVGYASVEPAVRQREADLHARPGRWSEILAGQRNALLLSSLIASYDLRVRRILDKRLNHPVRTADEVLVRETGRVAETLERVIKDLPSESSELTIEALEKLLAAIDAAFSDRVQNAIHRGTSRFRHRALLGHLSREIGEVIAEAPEVLTVIDDSTPLAETADLARIETTSVLVHDVVSHQILDTLLPEVLARHGEALELIASVPLLLSESTHVASYACEVALAAQLAPGTEWLTLIRESLGRAHDRVEQLHNELDGAFEAILSDVARLVDAAFAATREETLVSGRAARSRIAGRSWFGLLQRRARLDGARLRAAFGKAFGQVVHLVRALQQRSEVQSIRLRTGVDRLDPATMRTFIEAHLPCPERLELPTLYGRLFALTPVEDSRFFVARQRELALLESLHLAWQDGSKAAILIEGPIGSGKSSLLNVFQMRVKADRLFRLDGNFGTRGRGLVATLASDLDCEANLDAVHNALNAAPTAVFIDGAERWFEPSLAGVSDLENLKHLVARSDASVFWVVSLQRNALDQFDRLLAIRRVFSHHVVLSAIDAEMVRTVIESRHRLSGFDLAFGAESRWRRLTFWRRGTAEERYYRSLARAADGNLRAVVYGHLRTVSGRDSDHLFARPPRTVEVPFLAQLSDLGVVILVELLRLGTMERHVLERLLRVSPDELQVHVEALRLAGLVEPGTVGGTVKIPRHLREVLTVELHQSGRLVRGVS